MSPSKCSAVRQALPLHITECGLHVLALCVTEIGVVTCQNPLPEWGLSPL